MKTAGNDLIQRTISGVIFAAIVVGAVSFSFYSFCALLIVICAGAMSEFYKISALAGAKPLRYYGIAVGLFMLVCCALFIQHLAILCAMYLSLILLLLFIPIELFRKLENPIANIGAGVAGVLYIAVPLVIFIFISNSRGYNSGIALSYFLIIWASDVGAYLVGSAIGRHKLFERISPKKTWEGFFGGLIFAVGVGYAAALFFGFNIVFWIAMAAVISITGVVGDLVESMFKRSVGIKDSGRMIPGHGGFLDRFDSLLLSLPFAAIFFILFG